MEKVLLPLVGAMESTPSEPLTGGSTERPWLIAQVEYLYADELGNKITLRAGSSALQILLAMAEFVRQREATRTEPKP